MAAVAKEGEVLTLENMRSDWTRILDGRFCSPYRCDGVGKPDDGKSVAIRWNRKSVILTCGEQSVILPSISDAARFIGCKQPNASKAASRGGSLIDREGNRWSIKVGVPNANMDN